MGLLRSCIVAAVACGGCKFTPPGGTADADPRIDAANPEAGGSEGQPLSWLHPWAHRKGIKLLASQVTGNADLVDFPVLISITDPQLDQGAEGDGSDIAFTAGDGVAPLAVEAETYSNGKLVAWVKVPALSATADTEIYMYYGNGDAPPATPEAVWTADFEAVWHLQQDPGPGTAGDIRDSTSGHHDGTADASMGSGDLVNGVIARALHFNGSSAFLNFASMDVGNTFTISAWVNLQSNGAGIKTIFSNSLSGPTVDGFRLFVNTDQTSDRKVLFETGDGTTTKLAVTSASAVTMNAFSHVDAVVDRVSGNVVIYINGINASATSAILTDFNTSSDFEIGRMEDTFEWAGLLDEVEVAQALRSADWIQTAFTNQKSPTMFLALGSEEQEPQ